MELRASRTHLFHRCCRLFDCICHVYSVYVASSFVFFKAAFINVRMAHIALNAIDYEALLECRTYCVCVLMYLLLDLLIHFALVSK